MLFFHTLGIPQLILLTHVDQVCLAVQKDLKDVYSSQTVQDKVLTRACLNYHIYNAYVVGRGLYVLKWPSQFCMLLKINALLSRFLLSNSILQSKTLNSLNIYLGHCYCLA